MLLHDLDPVSCRQSRQKSDRPYQRRQTLHWPQLEEAIHLIIRQLEAKIGGQPEKNIAIRLQRSQKTRRRPVGHELRNVCQHFPIRRLVASAMGRAEENQTKSRISDRLVPRLQSCLQQSLKV
jgi:hypothetical protein